ncbi:MAG: hypothetical protein OD918_10880 [Gammaproteobacteria bacterium]
MQKLSDAYDQLKACAPCRYQRDKEYFVPDHDGMPGGEKKSTQREKKSTQGEEHLAMALFNDFAQKGEVAHAEMSKLQFLDYQFPLYAWQSDPFRAADLFGVIDDAHPCVVELKVIGKSDRVEAPLRALLEALAYCAVVEANMKFIDNEAQTKRNVSFATQKPRLMILAPDAYWQFFKNRSSAGNWQPAFRNLLAEIHEHLGVRAHLASLPDEIFSMGSKGVKPRLQGECILKSIQLES